MEAQDSKATNPAPNATMSAPTKSFARSSVTASSIPTPRSTSSPRSSAKPASRSALGVSSASSRSTAFKKKLYRYRPDSQPLASRHRPPRNAPSPYRATREASRLACGNCSPTRSWETWPASGCWSPNCSAWEPGTWCAAGPRNAPNSVEPRLALQLIHEAALCTHRLAPPPWLEPTDLRVGQRPALPRQRHGAVHELLGARTVADSQRFQMALGKVRRASGHFQGRLLAIDPHRVRSFSKRAHAPPPP